MRVTKKYLKFLLLTLATMCILCSCGGGHTVGYSGDSSEMNGSTFEITNNSPSDKVAIAELGNSSLGGAPSSTSGAGDQGKPSPTEKEISTDMLVYRGGVTTQTLDFDQAVQSFKALMTEYGAFVEDERIDTKDGNMYSYSDSADIRHTYNATVRIPSAKFNEFFEKSQGVGTAYGAWSNVENISQRYGTATTQLEIYQTKYERYLKLLAEAYNVEDMIEIERELTDIELKLAEYKTAISTMETDVAYSYLDMEIIEVRKATDFRRQPKTFLERLKDVVIESVDTFLVFLEGILFFLIMSWWYLLLIWLGLWLFIRWNKKRMAKYREEQARGNIPYMSPSRNYQAVRPVPSPHDQRAQNAQKAENAQNAQNAQKGYPDALRPEESIQKEDESDTKTSETAVDSEVSADDTESTNESEKSEET